MTNLDSILKSRDITLSTKVHLVKAERVTGRKARGPQTEEIGCKCQTFLSLLTAGGNKLEICFFLLYTNLKGDFS